MEMRLFSTCVCTSLSSPTKRLHKCTQVLISLSDHREIDQGKLLSLPLSPGGVSGNGFCRPPKKIKNTVIGVILPPRLHRKQFQTQIFVEKHAPRTPRQRFKQLPSKTQNPRYNSLLSKNEGTNCTQQTFL